MKINNFERSSDNTIAFIKNSKSPYVILIRDDNAEIVGFLEAITIFNGFDKNVISDLKEWREKNQIYFPSQFKVTLAGTKSWVKNQLIEKKDRLLFFVKNTDGKRIGHVGLYRFDYGKRTCELDNVIRGINYSPGIMTRAVNSLMKWTYREFNISKIFLTVFSDNSRAIKLYNRCGFVNHKYIPLKKTIIGKTITWVEIDKKSNQKPERKYLIMKHQK